MPLILLDTNVLLLWVIGSKSIDAIANFKRTVIFSEAHFNALSQHMARSTAAVTSAILTETSNLLGGREDLHTAIRDLVSGWRELEC